MANASCVKDRYEKNEGEKAGLAPTSAKAQALLPLGLDDLPFVPDFLVSDENKEAFLWIKRWPEWPLQGLFVEGPQGSGKGHVGRVWAKEAGAFICLPTGGVQAAYPHQGPQQKKTVDASKLFLLENLFAETKTPHVWVKNVETWLETGEKQKKLLALVNSVRERKGTLLVTGCPPFGWDDVLPDLASRLKALPKTRLHAPSEAFLKQVLQHLFDRVHLVVTEDALTFLAYRFQRSLGFMAYAVHYLNRESLVEKASITLAFLRRHAEKMGRMFQMRG